MSTLVRERLDALPTWVLGDAVVAGAPTPGHAACVLQSVCRVCDMLGTLGGIEDQRLSI